MSQTLAAAVVPDRVGRALATRLARDAELLPDLDRTLRRRFPEEPYRQRFGFIAERLRRTRAHLTGQAAPLTGRYADAAELDAELAEVQEALAADGLDRVAWGEVADLRWQLATFGFHLASLEVRQHSARPSRGRGGDRGRTIRRRELVPGVTAAEVLETLPDRGRGAGPLRRGCGRPLRHLVHRRGRRRPPRAPARRGVRLGR